MSVCLWAPESKQLNLEDLIRKRLKKIIFWPPPVFNILPIIAQTIFILFMLKNILYDFVHYRR